MRIRKPFAGAFVGLIILSAFAGFSPPDYSLPTYKQSDKVLHFLAFFLLTVTFYWIIETSRRKVLQLTFTVCTVGLGLASEIIQGLLPVSDNFTHATTATTATKLGVRMRIDGVEGEEGWKKCDVGMSTLMCKQIHRDFDYYDVLANVLGSLSAIGMCNWYHKRMLERKRAARGYAAVAGDDEHDVELGEGVGGQETGVVRSVDEELDNWDENVEDWDTTEPAENSNGKAQEGGDLGEGKKRSD